MKIDPIISEIHQTRQKILEECGYDLDRIMEYLQAAEAQDVARLISRDEFKGKNSLSAQSMEPKRA